jgi:hypothetical protein
MNVSETIEAVIPFTPTQDERREADLRLVHALGDNDTLRRALRDARDEITTLRGESTSSVRRRRPTASISPLTKTIRSMCSRMVARCGSDCTRRSTPRRCGRGRSWC